MSPFQGPSSGVPPGLRDPFGPAGEFFPWGDFHVQDLDACYPLPPWVARRRAFPQSAAGNALRDSLAVPFTRDEVKNALRELYFKRKTQMDRNCAPVAPASVHIALLVLPILESRNGGWIDFDADRPFSEPLVNQPLGQRANVFNLRCLLYQLPGKPLPPLRRGPCLAQQPRRLAALYNIRDISTTFDAAGAADRPPPVGPISGPSDSVPRVRELLGFELEATPAPEPEPFTYNVFEVFETFDIKGD